MSGAHFHRIEVPGRSEMLPQQGSHPVPMYPARHSSFANHSPTISLALKTMNLFFLLLENLYKKDTILSFASVKMCLHYDLSL